MSGQYKTLAKTGAIVDTRFKNSMKAAAARAAGAAIGITLVFGGVYIASLFTAEAGTAGGFTLAQAIEGGLVKEGSKLASVLGGMEAEYTAAQGSKSALDSLTIVQRATGALGLKVGIAELLPSGAITLTNVGGILTTLNADGSIVVQKGPDLLLHLVP
jgi:hypothetical protein